MDSCAEFTARRWQYSRDRTSREASGAAGRGGLAQAVKTETAARQYSNINRLKKIFPAPSERYSCLRQVQSVVESTQILI